MSEHEQFQHPTMTSAAMLHALEWISLQEASEWLGVAASTLRRWGDGGKVPMKRTLGGHRRFSRAAIAEIAASERQDLTIIPTPARHVAGPTIQPWTVDDHALARQEWHTRLMERPAAERMRGLGQRLLGLLIQHINSREESSRFVAEARAVGANYGREARGAAISMHDMVEAFLFFRHAFSQLAMPIPGVAQPTDLLEASALHSRIDHFMDAILLGAIASYEQEKDPTPSPSPF
jgi:excisionase family DNA binding protein